MAGIPFELLEKLATLNAARHARETVAAERIFSQSKLEVERVLASRRHDLSKEQFRAWRKAVRSGVMPPAVDPPSNTFAACWQNAVKFAAAEAILGRSLNRELNAARLSLMDSARRFLPSYLNSPWVQLANLSLRGGKASARVNATCSYTCSEFAERTTHLANSDQGAGAQRIALRPRSDLILVRASRSAKYSSSVGLRTAPPQRSTPTHRPGLSLRPASNRTLGSSGTNLCSPTAARHSRSIPKHSRYSSAVMGQFPRIR